MQYIFAAHEQNFADWCVDDYPGLPLKGREFIKNIESPNFIPRLWTHQLEAIKRTIYSFEILKKPDLLLNIVTGGGKTVIIAGMVAYLRIVHQLDKFLILVPNTIVRARLVDDFSPTSDKFTYDIFSFFFNAYAYEKDRLSLHIMRQGESPAGIRNANIILGNVHQIYEGKDNWRVIQENTDRLAIFNDEAHNTKAENYNDLINKLKPKRFFRLDTTATPDRLDGLHPDSEMIYAYDIRQAMREKIIKRVVVFRPDIEKVKLTYVDKETGKILSAEEMPWEAIEQKKIRATRYITNPKPMAQQLGIALECLKYHNKAVPPGEDSKPSYKPLLFVVAVSIQDAKNIKATIEAPPFNLKALLITNESEDEAKEEAQTINRDIRNCKYDAIVSVMMLREGWDVKNISVILLFRKFCYKKIGERIYSVYGPQIIGRGLRRINPLSDDWEQCHVVDHPIMKHEWLWDMIAASYYQDKLNPGDIIDEEKIPLPPEDKTVDEVAKKQMEEFDLSDLPDVPEPPQEYEPITEWQKYLDEYKYDVRGMSIDQRIKQIQSKNLDSGFDTLDSTEIPHITVKDVDAIAKPDIETRRKMILEQVRRLAYDAIMEFDANPDNRQYIILKVIQDHLKKRFLLGEEVYLSNNLNLLEMIWDTFNQVRYNFLNIELIGGILAQPPESKDYAES